MDKYKNRVTPQDKVLIEHKLKQWKCPGLELLNESIKNYEKIINNLQLDKELMYAGNLIVLFEPVAKEYNIINN